MPTNKDTQRFDAALATLEKLAITDSMEFRKAVDAVLEWLAAQPSPTLAKQTAGAQLSLGYHWTKSAAVTAHRDVLRALVLLLVTRFGIGLKGVPKSAVSGTPENARYSALQELRKRCNQLIVRSGAVKIDSNVYEWAGVKKFPDVAHVLSNSRERGAEVMRRAFAYVGTGSDSRGFLRKWFGTADIADVGTGVRRMMDSYHTKTIHFTANETTKGKLDSGYASAQARKWELAASSPYITVNLCDFFFEKTAVHSSQIVMDQDAFAAILERHIDITKQELAAEVEFDTFGMDPKEAVPVKAKLAKVHEELAVKKKDNLKAIPKRDDEKISVTGVVLHEVSHNTLATTDVEITQVTMYGPDLCLWLARNHPAKAVTNADSFRLFYEEFLIPGR